MPGKIGKIANLISNMGWRYVGFRARHELLRRSGLLKKKFPTAPIPQSYVKLEDWRKSKVQFFFADRESISFPRRPEAELKKRTDAMENGKLLLFNSEIADLGVDYNWVTNPDTGFCYDAQTHWTQIADLSKEAGDIKYVWEKSRFSYLYDFIRYDYHFGQDRAELVFRDILSWISANPVNCGPNYRCSQEMSLRVLNWLFALHYYRRSPVLTEPVFEKIQYAIYWHLHHIYNNIDFSRIAVRNNHAITETLTLYIAGLFFPAMPGAAMWKKKGRAWLEEEVAYQVYEDGTFIQSSMNYHRIVVQLMTWGIVLSERNGERFSDTFYDRARKSVIFLRTCMVDEHGHLPNYGANDGALFFKLGDAHYRDYRPQLQALAAALGMDVHTGRRNEDMDWYGLNKVHTENWQPAIGGHSFDHGGYYIIRESETLTFIRCCNYKDRPLQADNLHVDIWYKGVNILPDAGSYKYNTDEATMRYFSGSEGHNTVMIDDNDQMLKGGRFIWYYWTQRKVAALTESPDKYEFFGSIKAFSHIGNDIMHSRRIIKYKGRPEWEVIDEIQGLPKGMMMRQVWHVPIGEAGAVALSANDGTGQIIDCNQSTGWYSSLYGQKEQTLQQIFSSTDQQIQTRIVLAKKVL